MAPLASVLTLFLFAGVWGGETPYAADVSEAQVKAAFLMNFTKFIEWPAPNDGPLVLCIADDGGFLDIATEALRGRSFNGRDFQTRRLTSRDEATSCHVVFVGAIRLQDATALMQRIRGPVLTVGETVQFLRDGGMVRLYVENKRMRFQISQKNAEAQGLKVSSRLLGLAEP